MKSKRQTGARLGLLSRILAASLGAYALASAWSIALALAWPGARAEGVMLGLLGAFILGVLAVLWVFAVRNAWRAWAGLLLPAALLAGLAWGAAG